MIGLIDWDYIYMFNDGFLNIDCLSKNRHKWKSKKIL